MAHHKGGADQPQPDEQAWPADRELFGPLAAFSTVGAAMVGRHALAFVVVGCGLAAASPCAGQTPTPSAVTQDNPKTETPSARMAPGANSFVESQARALLQSRGFSEVSALVNDSSGIWRGTAVKDEKKVDVSVDFQGRVAAQ